MNINTNYSNLYPVSGTTKQTYIDKYDKSLKLPFMNVLNNNIAINTTAKQDNDAKIDASELIVNDNVELSSAVVYLRNSQ